MQPQHKRHILATFRHIEQLMEEIERLLYPLKMIANKTVNDLPPNEKEQMAQLLNSIRLHMAQFAVENGLENIEKEKDVHWAIHSKLGSMVLAINELDTRQLKGYGNMDKNEMSAISAFNRQMERYLGIGERILERSTDNTRK